MRAGNDYAILLAEAILAAVMAILIEDRFRNGERWLLPTSLRRIPDLRRAATRSMPFVGPIVPAFRVGQPGGTFRKYA